MVLSITVKARQRGLTAMRDDLQASVEAAQFDHYTERIGVTLAQSHAIMRRKRWHKLRHSLDHIVEHAIFWSLLHHFLRSHHHKQ